MSGIKKYIIGFALLVSITTEASTNNFKFFQKPSLVHSFNEMGSQTRLDALDDYAVVGVIQSGVNSPYEQNGAFYVFDPRTPQQSNTYQFIGAPNQYKMMKLGSQVAISQNKAVGLAIPAYDVAWTTPEIYAFVVGKDSNNNWETCNYSGAPAQYDCHSFGNTKNMQLITINHPNMVNGNRDPNNYRVALTDNLLAITNDASRTIVVYKFNASTKQWNVFFSKTYSDFYYVKNDNSLGGEKFSLAAYGDASTPDRIAIGLPSFGGSNDGKIEILTLNAIGTGFDTTTFGPFPGAKNHFGRSVDIYKSTIIAGTGKINNDAKPATDSLSSIAIGQWGNTLVGYFWQGKAHFSFFDTTIKDVSIGRNFFSAVSQNYSLQNTESNISQTSVFTFNSGVLQTIHNQNSYHPQGQISHSSIYNSFSNQNETWLSSLTNPFDGLSSAESAKIAGNNQLLIAYRQFPQRDISNIARHTVGGIAITSTSCSATENIKRNDNSIAAVTYSEITENNLFSGDTYDDAECNFGKEFDFWLDGGGNKKWKRHTGNTPSSNTGPSSGAGESDNYYYVETSAGGANNNGDTAIIETQDLYSFGRTISFDYHMYGADIGQLELQYFHQGDWYTITYFYGDQGNQWKNYSYNLGLLGINFSTIKLRLKYTAIGGYKGDIALDNIKIIKSP